MSTHGNYKAREGRLNLPINPQLKALWVSQSEPGETLADRIEHLIAMDCLARDHEKMEKWGLLHLATPDHEKPDPLPRWTQGLNRRTAECLIKAGYTGKVSVRRDAANGFDHLPNWGKKCTEDLQSWLTT